jgi:hypothetical protein
LVNPTFNIFSFYTFFTFLGIVIFGGIPLLSVLPTPGTKEDYEILADYLGRFALEPGKFHLCADLKVINITVGQMPHSSRHPCYACYWVKNDENDDYPMRTFEGNREHNQAWVNDGSDPDRLKNFFNCRSVPMDFFPQNGIILSHVPPPSLHIMLGMVNHFYDSLELLWKNINKWAEELQIVRTEYHGGGFEGRECRKLVDGVDVLERLVNEEDFRPTRANPSRFHPGLSFVYAIKAYGVVMEKCFGHTLHPVSWLEAGFGGLPREVFKDRYSTKKKLKFRCANQGGGRARNN